jgi:hypothetical protein
MRGFKVREKLSRWPHLVLFCVLQALTDALLGIGTGGDVEEALIGFSVLDDGRRLYCSSCRLTVESALAAQREKRQERTCTSAVQRDVNIRWEVAPSRQVSARTGLMNTSLRSIGRKQLIGSRI